MKRRKRPDPGNEFWDGYWDRLQVRMGAEGASEPAAERTPVLPAPRRIIPLIPRWAMAAAAGLVLLVGGIQIGRLTAPGRTSAGRTADRTLGRDPLLAGQVADYLTRSKVILLSLANFEPASEDPTALSPAVQQQVSRGAGRPRPGAGSPPLRAGGQALQKSDRRAENHSCSDRQFGSRSQRPGRGNRPQRPQAPGDSLQDFDFPDVSAGARKRGQIRPLIPK